jgi:ABC-2 type transport system permease protein
LILAAGFVALALVGGLPLALFLETWTPTLTPGLALGLDVSLLLILTLMLSQTVSQAVETFYSRRDLDLLLSSPIPASRILAVRCLGLAVTTTATYAGLLAPILLVVAAFGHFRWLNLFPVLFATGLLATTLGLAAAMGLFAVIGPRRTRTAAQMLAAFTGAAFFLGAQVFNFARDEVGGQVTRVVEGWIISGAFDRGSPLSWPARAALGEPGPALGMLAASIVLFIGAVALLGRRFAHNAAAAAGAQAAKPARPATAASGGFASGVTGAVVRKELKLLARDPALISQIGLRLLYLFPLLFLLWQSGENGQGIAVPSLAAAVAFLTSQLAGSLGWVTVSGEDAPDLLAVSPSSPATLRRAKAFAAVIPVAAIMALPLLGFAVISPWAGLVALLGCTGAAFSAVLIALWVGKPAGRRDFNRRQTTSTLGNIAEFVAGGAWAAATAAGVAQSIWVLPPLVLLVLVLTVLRRRSQRRDVGAPTISPAPEPAR